MISVTILVGSKQNYTGIEMLGHAGLADNHQDGQKLVYATVSTLTLSMANSAEQFTDDAFEADMDEETGLSRSRFAQSFSSGSKLLMNSPVFSLEDIAEVCGEPYIKIQFEEV